MPLKLNPITGELDLVMSPGHGTATIQIDGDTGSATPTAVGVISVVGGLGIVTAAATNTLTITATSGGFTWTEVTGTSSGLVDANGYIANNAGLITFTLPVTAVIGDQFEIVGKGAGLFAVAQNAGQTIHFIASDTTTGVGGSLTAIEQYASLSFVCITDNTDFAIISSTGNFTIV